MNILMNYIIYFGLIIFTFKWLSMGFGLIKRFIVESVKPLPFRFVSVSDDDEIDFNDLFDRFYMTDGVNYYDKNGEVLFFDVID